MDDEDIDFSDIPELTEEDFQRAQKSADMFRERGTAYPSTGSVQITVHKEDGSIERYDLDSGLQRQVITLDPDVSQYFPDSESVNRTLRSLISLIPQPD